MKNYYLFITLALVLTLFSCTTDEQETQVKSKLEKNTNNLQADAPNPDGPGDKWGVPPTKP